MRSIDAKDQRNKASNIRNHVGKRKNSFQANSMNLFYPEEIVQGQKDDNYTVKSNEFND